MRNLFYNILKRQKQPCIYMTFEGPPVAVQQDMEGFGWDTTPYLDSGQLRFIDCFSFRNEPTRTPPFVHLVKDPRDLHSVTSALFTMMDEMRMTGQGAVFVDSLTEMFTLVQEERPLVFHMLDGIKSWRARGPKEQLVPFFLNYHIPLRAYMELDDLLFCVVECNNRRPIQPQLRRERATSQTVPSPTDERRTTRSLLGHIRCNLERSNGSPTARPSPSA